LHGLHDFMHQPWKATASPRQRGRHHSSRGMRAVQIMPAASCTARIRPALHLTRLAASL
jgi:hypothetical protein